MLVETLAYQYTRQPPKLVRPRHNVVVRLCSIECSFVQPLAGPAEREVPQRHRGLEPHRAAAVRLGLRDQLLQLHPAAPEPAGAGARTCGSSSTTTSSALFEQGDAGSTVGDFVRLRAWLLAHLMWNPQADEKALVREFLARLLRPGRPAPAGAISI